MLYTFLSHLECPVQTTVLRLQPIGGGIYIIVRALLILKLLAVNGPRLQAVSSDTDSSLPITSLVSGVKYYIYTVEPLSNGHFGTNINSTLYRGCPL